jgi:pimeloyl-ACP methyl ester carboxylesterase
MFKYKNININYERYGSKKGAPIVLLHGWGQNIQMMKPIGDHFPDNDIIILDLPGHGKSEEPKEVWTLYDFADMVHDLLASLKIENPILIGHSFGGKISLIYASKYKVKKLILFGSPFKSQGKDNTIKVKILKAIKKLPGMDKFSEFAKQHMGSTDYRNASPLMRQILVEHVNTDITEDVKKIKCPTIIIWGDHDQAVPIADAYILEKLIPDAAVIVYDGCTHYAYLERLGQTVSIIKTFIKEKEHE